MVSKKGPTNSSVPEDGSKWFIMLAFSLSNMVIIPTVQLFGLLYKDLLSTLKMTAVEINTIIALNYSFGMLLAVFNGPVLRKYSFRKIAIFGVLLVFIGNILTSQSNSFWNFILCFSIIASVGMNFAMAAFHLAFNTYFVVKRGIASNITMLITGLGPIIMPLVASFFMANYGTRETGIIMSVIILFSLIGACYLQPVKWHKNNIENVELEAKNIEKLNYSEDEAQSNDYNPDAEDEIVLSTKLMDNIDVDKGKSESNNERTSYDSESSFPLKSLDDIVRPYRDTVFERISKFFDLDLLRDPIFINISLSLSVAFVSEMNFTLMLPFILKERSFDTNQIAVLLSVMAVADLISRLVSSFFGQSKKNKVRVMYLISLMSGIFCRIWFLYSISYFNTVIVIFALGVTKGTRTVYTTLVIPTYFPISKLVSATGLQVFSNGILFLVLGPLMGFVRQLDENYTIWIHVINCFIICAALMWFVDIYLLRVRKRDRKASIVITNEC